jgi:hypothetical protein
MVQATTEQADNSPRSPGQERLVAEAAAAICNFMISDSAKGLPPVPMAISLAKVAIDVAAGEIERLRAALRVCGAPFDTGPTTVMGAAQIIGAEFERRMNYAANTLNDGTVPAPTRSNDDGTKTPLVA